jgi:outer membrane protein assembly factor BamB
MYGQWASPAVAVVDGKRLAVFPGGDGCLYAFDALTGHLHCKVDCNDLTATDWGRFHRGTRCFPCGTPAICEDTVYVSLYQDSETPPNAHCSICAVSLRNGGVIKWRYAPQGFDGAFGSVAVNNDSLFLVSRTGTLIALERSSGNELWRADLESPPGRLGAPYIHESKVYVGTEDGTLLVFRAERSRKCIGTYAFGRTIMGSPAIVDHDLYVATDESLWAIKCLDK